MTTIHSIQEIVKHHLCISCGACVSAAPLGSMEMVLCEKQGIFVPRILDPSRVSGDGLEFRVCPGKGLPIVKMGQNLYGSANHDTSKLGHYRLAIAAHTANPCIQVNASSGGVMTEIAWYLLENDLVQGVTASRFVYGPPGPRTQAFIAYSLKDLLSAQGSKYCPTSTNELVRSCVEAGGRYLFLGTPCQVGALRLALEEDPSLNAVFPYTMANFCGGYRDFRYLDGLLSSYGINPADVELFRFRGDGQPGSMFAKTRTGKTVSKSYPGYGYYSILPKQKRCRYCVDATGELADFSCGDVWISRFLEDKDPWSIIIARSAFAERIVHVLIRSGLLKAMAVSYKEICESQKSNIASKKIRQYKRRQVSRFLRIAMPMWDIAMPSDAGSYLLEIQALFIKTRIGMCLRKIKHVIGKALRILIENRT